MLELQHGHYHMLPLKKSWKDDNFRPPEVKIIESKDLTHSFQSSVFPRERLCFKLKLWLKMQMVGPKCSPWSLWVLGSKLSCFRIGEWSAANICELLIAFFLQSFTIGCRIWQQNRSNNALLDTLLAQWGFMVKCSKTLFAGIFNKFLFHSVVIHSLFHCYVIFVSYLFTNRTISYILLNRLRSSVLLR